MKQAWGASARPTSASARCAHLVQGMATLGDNVRLLAWESKAKAERFEADGALVLLVVVLGGDDGQRGVVHGVRVGVVAVVDGGGSKGANGGFK